MPAAAFREPNIRDENSYSLPPHSPSSPLVPLPIEKADRARARGLIGSPSREVVNRSSDKCIVGYVVVDLATSFTVQASIDPRH